MWWSAACDGEDGGKGGRLLVMEKMEERKGDRMEGVAEVKSDGGNGTVEGRLL